MSFARMNLKGVTCYNRAKAYNGYTLFSPWHSGDIWLIDMQGHIVHQWKTPYEPYHSRLLSNGNLLYAGIKSGGVMGPGIAYALGVNEEEIKKPSEERGVRLVEVGWDGNLVWKYDVPEFNHDFYRLENGNTMFIKYAIVPDDLKGKVKGGIQGTEQDGVMWSDAINEITPEGKVIWEWISHEHLDPEIDIICPLEYRGEWTHMNSCYVLPDGDVLVSIRQFNTIAIIDKATGDIKWRWGFDVLGHQHDATMLDNGNILVFDNGAHRLFSKDLDYYSTILEINPSTDKIEWIYKDDPPSDFYSYGMGGCQRLPNNNTLICETLSGRIFEVTYDGEIVWEYINPFYGSYLAFGQCNLIYRAYRYGPDYEGLKGKDLDPGNFEWINGVYGPNAFTKGQTEDL